MAVMKKKGVKKMVFRLNAFTRFLKFGYNTK